MCTIVGKTSSEVIIYFYIFIAIFASRSFSELLLVCSKFQVCYL